jgi:lysyl-tRNA synthetase class 2
MDFIVNLKARAQMMRIVRSFFDGLGFIEVETPVRIAAPAPEPHIDCPPCGGMFLRASPELQMKKLLASGMERIYQIGPCFRDGEKGSRHNPEFTMLEWYRAGATYMDILEDAKSLLRAVFAGTSVEASTTVETVRRMYARFAGWDPFDGFDQDRFDYDMATKIEPNLPGGFVFLIDYPPEAASLSRLRGGVAERWELYHDGLELANCFTELCDGEEQRRRFAEAREERRRIGECDYPVDEEFLDMLPLVKSAAGVAFGVDRLAMLRCGAASIADVRML